MRAPSSSEPYRFSGSRIVCDEGAFDPEQVGQLRTAFEAACGRLSMPPADVDARLRLARIMLVLARTRAASAHEMVDDALIWFARGGRAFFLANRDAVDRREDAVPLREGEAIGGLRAALEMLRRDAPQPGREAPAASGEAGADRIRQLASRLENASGRNPALDDAY